MLIIYYIEGLLKNWDFDGAELPSWVASNLQIELEKPFVNRLAKNMVIEQRRK